MNTLDLVKRMAWPVGILAIGLITSLLWYVWILPFSVGSAAAIAIMILAPLSEKKFLDGLALTIFFSAMMFLAIGIISTLIT